MCIFKPFETILDKNPRVRAVRDGVSNALKSCAAP